MSYGTNAPQGLQPYSMLSGACWNQQTSQYLLASGYGTPLYQGDPVTILNNGTIGIGVAGSAIVGVFWGVRYQDTSGTLINSTYWAASTTTFNPGGGGAIPATAFIIDDPYVLFNIQCTGTNLVSGSVNTINVTDLNLNYNFISGTGSTISGQSAYALNNASAATTATLNLKLVSLTPAVNNSFGLTYNNGLVLINNHIYKGGTGTAGV